MQKFLALYNMSGSENEIDLLAIFLPVMFSSVYFSSLVNVTSPGT